MKEKEVCFGSWFKRLKYKIRSVTWGGQHIRAGAHTRASRVNTYIQSQEGERESENGLESHNHFLVHIPKDPRIPPLGLTS
jgi:hypothetical protein